LHNNQRFGFMLNFTYENQGSHTYLVYKMEDNTVDTMILGMLANNNIKGFAKHMYMENNGEKIIKYNVSAKIPLRKLFMGSVTKSRVLNVFINILDGIISVEDYMLDVERIVIDLDYIFADVSTSEVSMICLPVVEYNNGVNLHDFFKNTIFSLTYDSKENGDYIAKLIAYLNNGYDFTVVGFRDFLASLLNDNQFAQTAPATPAASEPMAPVNHAGMYQQANNMYAATSAPAMAPQPAIPQPVIAPQPAQIDGKNIDNVYVNSSKSAKMIQRSEKQKQEQASSSIPAMDFMAPAGNNNLSFEVPGMGPAQVKTKAKKEKNTAPKQAASSSEEDVSLMYLLQHYNKDNVAKYKETKERKKRDKATAKGGNVETPSAPAPARQPMVQQPAMRQPVAQPVAQQPAMRQPVTPPMPQPAAPVSMPQPMAQQSATPAMAPQPVAPAMPQQPAAPAMAPQPVAPTMPQPATPTIPQPAAPAMPQQPAMGFDAFKPQQEFMPSSDQTVFFPDMGKVESSNKPEAPKAPAMPQNMGACETTVLTSGVSLETKPYLYRFKNGEKIYIDKHTFKVGKSDDVVDWCIYDNTAISRCHAIFYKIDGQCYIEDLNSTNGTYIDDEKITSNEKIAIRVGTRIKFANEEFELRFE